MATREAIYQQCILVKRAGATTFQRTSWIPQPYCRLGRVLKLRDDDGRWDDGWEVQHVGGKQLSHDRLPDSHKLIKAHRRATGDDLPKEKR